MMLQQYYSIHKMVQYIFVYLLAVLTVLIMYKQGTQSELKYMNSSVDRSRDHLKWRICLGVD